MRFVHPQLAMAIGWKFNHQPGMETSGGGLTGWPTTPWPTDQELAGYVAQYETYLASPQSKDDELQQGLERGELKALKAVALVLIDKGICTLAELRTKYRSL